MGKGFPGVIISANIGLLIFKLRKNIYNLIKILDLNYFTISMRK